MEASAPAYGRWFDEAQVAGLSKELGDPPEFALLRKTAFEAFLTLPIEPDPLYRKYAYFRGTDLTDVSPSSGGSTVGLPPLPAHVIRVVHDGTGSRLEVPEEFRAAGVQVRTLPHILRAGDEVVSAVLHGVDVKGKRVDKFEALSTAFLNRGLEVDVPAHCPFPVRIQDLTILSRPREALAVRRHIHAGAQSRVIVSEEVYSTGEASGQRYYGSVVRAESDESARLAYLSVHAPDEKVVSSYSRSATIGPNSQLSWVSAGLGGFRTRSRNYSDIVGNGGDLSDLQSFYGDNQQAYDSYVQITHIGTDTHGQSITRGVFRDESRGVSRGMARMEKEARKTISYLSEHAMLLSKGARSDTIPVLEILCRDVKATHSSSVAPVDPERVFYLESRGIPRQQAIRMISEGFLSYVFDRAPIAGLREYLYPHLTTRWEGRQVAWTDGGYPALPALELLGVESGNDWRFDTKLR
ncbi:MAG: SufD family Fe-S cluster assembly protein [Thermoplasmata archaeon]